MPAPKGNNYNKKWKTQKERQEAFEEVYNHLAAGFSKESFPLADWDTVEAYIKEFPEDFPPKKINEAMRYQRLKWERLGMDGAMGNVDGFNATAWIFNMKNRFSAEWRDKQVNEHVGKDDSELKITWQK